MKKAYFINILVVCCVFISLIISGCGGGGGGSAIDIGASGGGRTGNISVKMNMLNYSAGTSFVSIPTGITGRVNVAVKSVKTNKEVANKTVDFNAGFLTFDNEIPIHDTYSVSIKANLHYKPNDTFEVVWTGVSKEIYIYSNDEASQKALANEVQVGLKFLTIEFVKLYPAKIVFEPELPLTELVKGSIIPPFKVKVLEQFGNVLPSASGDISVSLHSGMFKNGMVTKSLSAGIAKFGEISVFELVADAQGQAKLEANYSGVVGYSQPMRAINAITPNASVTGYLSDSTTAPAAAAPSNSNVSNPTGKGPAYAVKAPSVGKQVFLIADNVEYQTVTDINGFYKFDIKLSSDLAPVKLTVDGPSGPIVSNMSATKGKTQIVIVKVDASGNVRLQKAVLEGNYSEAQDISVMEKLVEAEIIKIRTSATGATGVSGRIVSTVDGSGVSGASINIKENGESTVSGSGGVFNISPANGLKAGNYNIGAAKSDFIDSAVQVSITEDDYGFGYDGSLINIDEKPQTPPVLTNLSINGVTGEINITYAIDDPDKTHLCGVEVYYSIDGGLSYFNKASISGDASNLTSGPDKKITWHSTSDFLSKQSNIRLKLIPFDRRIQGAPVESNIFEVDNLSLTDNKVPSITSVIASGNSGEIQLNFDLSDGDNDSCSIELYYSLDDGASIKRSINLVDISKRHFPGKNLSVVWDSYKDIKNNQKSVKVRLVPNDSKTSGSWGESQIFELNNLINTPPAVSMLAVSGIKDKITLTYDIIDLDNNLCTAEVYFSTDGVSFKQAFGITGDTKEIASGTGKKLVWDSRADITDNFERVIIKVVPSDEYGYGSEAVSEPAPVYNRGFRPQITNLSTTGSDNKITLTYDISDKDGELATVEVYYSTNGGSAFTKAVEISGDTSVVMIAGTLSPAKKIIWNSIMDFKTNEPDVKVKLTPSDEAGTGTEAVSLAFAVNNAGFRPVVSNLTTVGNSGDITLKYDLADADSSPCFIEVQYGKDNSVFSKTLNLTGETAEITAGIGKTLIWNSMADIPGSDTITIRLIASDAGGPGTEAVSLPFKVINNTVPVASNVITTGNSGNITVTYDLTDPNNDTCSVELYYSTDGGTTYKKTANISGTIANVTSGVGNKLIWSSTSDIIQQNIAGVKIKVIPYDASGAGTPFESTPFAVNNYIQLPIVPVLQKAEFVLFTGGPAIKMTFDTNVSGSSSTIDLSKIFLNNSSLLVSQNPSAPALKAPSQNGISRASMPPPYFSGNEITVCLATLTPFQKCFGFNGDFISKGLVFLSGNGVKSSTGTEAAANIQPYKVYPLIDTAIIKYNNATGKLNTAVSILTPGNITGHIEVVIASVPPADGTTPTYSTYPDLSEQSMIGWSPDSVSIPGAPHPAGQRVYYRYNSTTAGNKTEWIDYGPIPDASALFGSGNIAWSNPRSQVDVKTTRIGSKNGRIKVYENLYGGATYTFKGETDPAQSVSNDGYIPGSYNVGTSVTIAENYTPVFTLLTSSGIESDYFKGANIIAPPGNGVEPFNSARIKHNGSNYQLFMASAGTLSHDARVYVGTDKIGRIAAGNYNANDWVTVYSETSKPDSLNSTYPAYSSDSIYFSYLNADGSESTKTPFSTLYRPPTAFITWSNTGSCGALYATTTIISGSVPTPEAIKVYEKNNGLYTYKGTITIGTNGISGLCPADSGGQKIGDNLEVSYVYVNFEGNESPFADDGIVPATPTASIAANLRLAYNTDNYNTDAYDVKSYNYEIKNIGGAALNIGANDLKVFIDDGNARTLIGRVLKNTNILAGGFPGAGKYVTTNNESNDANGLKTTVTAGGTLYFTTIDDTGNESDFYTSTYSVPAAPTNISAARVRYFSFGNGGGPAPQYSPQPTTNSGNAPAHNHGHRYIANRAAGSASNRRPNYRANRADAKAPNHSPSSSVHRDPGPPPSYNLNTYNNSIDIETGTRVYIGKHIALASAVSESVSSNSSSTEPLNAITPNPDGTGGMLWFVIVSAEGNESAKIECGNVPNRPDNTKIGLRNGLGKFSVTSQIASVNTEWLNLYRNYNFVVYADPYGPYTTGSLYQLNNDASLPLISDGNEAEYTIEDDNGNESSFSGSSVIPSTPWDHAYSLKLAYNGGNYEVKNIGGADLNIGVNPLNIYYYIDNNNLIGQVKNGITISTGVNCFAGAGNYASSVSKDANGLKTSFTSAGYLRFTTIDANGNESDFAYDDNDSGTDCIPAALDPTKLTFLNTDPEFDAPSLSLSASISGSENDVISLYEKTSDNYVFKGIIKATTDGFTTNEPHVFTDLLSNPLPPNPITDGQPLFSCKNYISGNESVIIAPGLFHHFELVLGSPQRYGNAFIGTNTITAKDWYGNTVTTDLHFANTFMIIKERNDSLTFSGLPGSNPNEIPLSSFVNGVYDLTGKIICNSGSDGDYEIYGVIPSSEAGDLYTNNATISIASSLITENTATRLVIQYSTDVCNNAGIPLSTGDISSMFNTTYMDTTTLTATYDASNKTITFVFIGNGSGGGAETGDFFDSYIYDSEGNMISPFERVLNSSGKWVVAGG